MKGLRSATDKFNLSYEVRAVVLVSAPVSLVTARRGGTENVLYFFTYVESL